jgi:hypothetical protein
MILQEYFKTPIWVEQKSEWLQEVNKACDPHIKEAKKRNADKIKKQKNDFAIVHHSGPIATDPNLKFFIEYIGQKSVDFLDFMGLIYLNILVFLQSVGFKNSLKQEVEIIILMFIVIIMYQGFII